jgi:hypothetical protein
MSSGVKSDVTSVLTSGVPSTTYIVNVTGFATPPINVIEACTQPRNLAVSGRGLRSALQVADKVGSPVH